LLLQVHDELVLEVPAAEALALGAEVREAMEGALHLEVPIRVNIGIGASWAEIH
jgi:DNA polymerase-1